MGYIFVSYSSQDRPFALKLADQLAQFFEVWIDREGLEGGMEWEKEIEEAVTECNIFLVLVSPNSNESDWVARETILAEQLKKERIPLLLDGKLPFRLLNLQYVDFQGAFEGGFRDLLEALQEMLSPMDETQAAVNQLLAEAIRARLASDYAQADNLIGQALAIQPDLAQSVNVFWSRLSYRAPSDTAAQLREMLRDGAEIVMEETQLLDDARYGSDEAYEWSIYLNLDDDLLDKIDAVEYLLHETFQPPRRIVRDRASKFRLTMVGWGIFEIPVTIRFNDGSSATTSYHLRFDV